MTRYIFRRLAAGLAVLIVVAVLVFALFAMLDSDAAVVILSRRGGGDPSPEQLAALRAELGLDRAAPIRFLDWAGGLLHGDLGHSLISGRPVGRILGERLANSAALAACTVLVLVPLSIGLGLLAGMRPGSRTDRAVSIAALVLESVPSFVVGVVLVAVVSLSLRLLPAVSLVPAGTSAWSRPDILVLPVLCLLAGLLPHPIRMVRARTVEVMESPYIRTARINGIGSRRLAVRQVCPAVVSTAVHPLAGSIVGLIGGIAVVETLFEYPGVSKELLTAIAARDYPFVQSTAVLLAAFGVGAYLVADLLALLTSPRARAVATGAVG